MSSELYVRWEVENKERLHQQLKQQLDQERQRQADMLRSIASSISSITSKINAVKNEAAGAKNSSVVNSERMSNISDYDTSEIAVSGISNSVEQTQVSATSDRRNLVAIDWSDLLDSIETAASDKVKKASYAQEINGQLATAIIENDEDNNARNEFISYLNSLLNDDELDFDYFKELVDRRFASLKNRIEFLAPDEVTDDLFEYYALCELLGIKRKKIAKENIKQECEKLFAQYAEKQKKDYVYQNLVEVFQELNMSVVDEMVLDGLAGQKVVDETIPDFSIFMSIDGGGIVFETVAEVDSSESLSSDKKAVLEESAHKVCQKHLQIIQKMHERGIVIKIECEEKPKAERIRKVKTHKARKAVRGKNKSSLSEVK